MKLPSRDIDIGLLRSFVAVADTGQITLASRAVHRSQSAVSQQMRRLEEALGVTLLDRSGAALCLTRHGQRLVDSARGLLAANDHLVDMMRGNDCSGEVHLGVPVDLVGALLPPLLRAFCRANPEVSVVLVSDVSAVLCAKLRSDDLDIALTTDPVPGQPANHLFKDRLVWVGAPDGDAFLRKPLLVALGQENCAFREHAVDSLRRDGRGWRPIHQKGHLESVFATLEADMAVAPFMACSIPRQLSIVPGLPELPAFHVNLRQGRSEPTTAVKRLAEHLRRALRGRWSCEGLSASDV